MRKLGTTQHWVLRSLERYPNRGKAVVSKVIENIPVVLSRGNVYASIRTLLSRKLVRRIRGPCLTIKITKLGRYALVRSLVLASNKIK